MFNKQRSKSVLYASKLTMIVDVTRQTRMMLSLVAYNKQMSLRLSFYMPKTLLTSGSPIKNTPLTALKALPVKLGNASSVAAAPWEYPSRIKHSFGLLANVVWI